MYRHGFLRTIWLVVLSISLLAPIGALAHEGATVGKYELEVGWVEEPVLLDRVNAVFLSVTNSDTNEPVEGLTKLQVSVSTGGESRELRLRPLSEETPGQYAADFIPTVRGQYTVKLGGQIEDQPVDLSVDIEEVELAENYQFPIKLPSAAELSQEFVSLQEENQALRNAVTLNQWLAVGGMALGLASLAVGFINWRRQSK